MLGHFSGWEHDEDQCTSKRACDPSELGIREGIVDRMLRTLKRSNVGVFKNESADTSPGSEPHSQSSGSSSDDGSDDGSGSSSDSDDSSSGSSDNRSGSSDNGSGSSDSEATDIELQGDQQPTRRPAVARRRRSTTVPAFSSSHVTSVTTDTRAEDNEKVRGEPELVFRMEEEMQTWGSAEQGGGRGRARRRAGRGPDTGDVWQFDVALQPCGGCGGGRDDDAGEMRAYACVRACIFAQARTHTYAHICTHMHM